MYIGHFAECNTRQRGASPSVRAIASTKKEYLGIGKASLPSATDLALGKEASFAERLLEHSAKKLTKGPTGDLFVEC
jgi:hypothetical protein